MATGLLTFPIVITEKVTKLRTLKAAFRLHFALPITSAGVC